MVIRTRIVLTILSFVVARASMNGAAVPTPQSPSRALPTVEVSEATGEPILGFQVRDKPKDPEMPHLVSMRLFPADVRDRNGQTVRGLGFTAWQEGSKVIVFVAALTPRNPGVRSPTPRIEDFVSSRLERFQLAIGESHKIGAMTGLGLSPLNVRLEPAGEHEH